MAWTLRLIIYKSFPDSYYYSSLPGDLAKTEKLLGDAFYLNQNYKAAWQAYRKALMRSFPDNELHQLHVYLSLAKTYESANNLQEAVDIFLYLSNNFKNPKVKEAALVFINKHEKTIREKKMGIQNLISAYSDQKWMKRSRLSPICQEKIFS